MLSAHTMATNPHYPHQYDYHSHSNVPDAAPSMRPTLDVYYNAPHQSYHQSLTPSPQHSQHAAPIAPQGYYMAQPHQQLHFGQAFTITPSSLASSTSLKRKVSGSSVATTPASASTPGQSSSLPISLSHDKLCDLCHHPDPILSSAKCGHLFHSRCVNVWPISHCPVCRVDMPQISVLRINMNEQIDTRSGKWTRAEEKFIEMILQEFDRNCFPLANGTPVRLVLAKLLNCSTMRLSKKFQKNALGKRTFRIPKPTKGVVAMEFNQEDHVMREKEFSRLETIFRHELVEMFRRENNTDEGAYVETINLRKAVKQFWVANFLKFAVVVGQPVEGLDVSDAKKKKMALQMLRDGQFDNLLSWYSPMSPTQGSYSNPAVSPIVGTKFHELPIKKHRSQEMSRMQSSYDNQVPQHFDNQVQQQQHVAVYDYGRMQPQSGYSSQYSQDVYGSYATSSSMVKHSRSPQQLHHSPHHHHQVQPYPEPSQFEMTSYLDRQPTSVAMSSAPHRSTITTSTSMTQQSYQPIQSDSAASNVVPSGATPWDLLEEFPAESSSNVVDPSLQAWSNLNMM